jgi:D-3-phosphoglycerate dehydrogenase / 2-oxoglutarate reductase
MKILVTCPPMLGMIDNFRPIFNERGIQLTAPDVVQTLPVSELIKIVPEHDGWIIGDDPATREVFEAGSSGNLRAVVKWGIGIDNVDFDACKDLNIPITNTPNMFGMEVADVAVGYLIALARETFEIDRAVRQGEWIKPRGVSLSNKKVALIGFGDIGQNTAKRLLAMNMDIISYDPYHINDKLMPDVSFETWPNRIEEADFIIVTCSLSDTSYKMINSDIFEKVKKGIRIVNVGRGPIIDELALENALISEKVYSAALDVYEVEPLPMDSMLRSHPRCIFGSHNSSNTSDAVERTSLQAINKLFEFLDVK